MQLDTTKGALKYGVVLLLVSKFSTLLILFLLQLTAVSVQDLNSPIPGYIATISGIAYLTLIGPFIETIFFHYIPYLVLAYFRANSIVAIVIISILFAISHTYSAWYIVAILPSAIALALSMVNNSQVSIGKGFWRTFWLHGAMNSVNVILSLVVK